MCFASPLRMINVVFFALHLRYNFNLYRKHERPLRISCTHAHPHRISAPAGIQQTEASIYIKKSLLPGIHVDIYFLLKSRTKQ
jgi:hypothetical protein